VSTGAPTEAQRIFASVPGFPYWSASASTATDNNIVGCLFTSNYSAGSVTYSNKGTGPTFFGSTITLATAGSAPNTVSGSNITAGSYVMLPTISLSAFTHPSGNWLFNWTANTTVLIGLVDGTVTGISPSPNYGLGGSFRGFVPPIFNTSTIVEEGGGKRSGFVSSPPGAWSGASNPSVVGTLQCGGAGALFDVYVMSNYTTAGSTMNYFVQMLNGGALYNTGMTIVIAGANLGGVTGTNDLTITVTSVSNTVVGTYYNTPNFYGISGFTFTGTPATTAISVANASTAYIYSNAAGLPYIQSNSFYNITGIFPTGHNISNAYVLYSTSSNTVYSYYNTTTGSGSSGGTSTAYGSSPGGASCNIANTGLFIVSNLGGYNEKQFTISGSPGKITAVVPVGAYSAFANVTYSAGANNTFTLYALQSNVSNSYQKIVVAVSGTVTTPTGSSQTASYTNPWFVSNSPIGTLIQPTVTMSGPDTIVIDSSSGFVYMLDTTSNIYRATTNVTVSNTTYNGIVYPGTTIGGATMTSAFGIPSTLFVSTAIGGANVLYSIYSYPITATNIAGMYVFSVTPGY